VTGLASTALPLDNAWKHIFFTYDGSGRASGVKIYVNGVPVVTHVLKDNLSSATIRTNAPMQLGWRNPDEHPAKDARYQVFAQKGKRSQVLKVEPPCWLQV